MCTVVSQRIKNFCLGIRALLHNTRPPLHKSRIFELECAAILEPTTQERVAEGKSGARGAKILKTKCAVPRFVLERRESTAKLETRGARVSKNTSATARNTAEPNSGARSAD